MPKLAKILIQNGVRHGEGTLYFSSDPNDKVKGLWVNGILQGKASENEESSSNIEQVYNS